MKPSFILSLTAWLLPVAALACDDCKKKNPTNGPLVEWGYILLRISEGEVKLLPGGV
jgi:hypothetical protein